MAESLPSDFLKPPLLLQLQNRLMTGLRDLGLRSQVLDAAEIVEVACRCQGLEPAFSSRFRDALDELCGAFGDGSELTYLGFQELYQGAVVAVQNRLVVEQACEENPEILEIEIDRPLVIAGFPRTGTTLLQSLLNLDSGARWLRAWEPHGPYPPASVRWGGEQDERRVHFEAAIARLRKGNDPSKAIHAIDSPAECCELMVPTFQGPEILGFLGLEGYRNWIDSLNAGTWHSVYEFYKKHLQYLAWREPPKSHWVLKSPDHIAHLDALSEVLPDALVVHTHRDPMAFLAAECWFIYSHVYSGTRRPNPKELGPLLLKKFSEWARHCLEFRQQQGSGRFVDVWFDELQASPLHTVERIYAQAERKLLPEMRGAIERYLKDNPRPPRSARYYDLGEFGLSADEVKEAFAEYQAFFGGKAADE